MSTVMDAACVAQFKRLNWKMNNSFKFPSPVLDPPLLDHVYGKNITVKIKLIKVTSFTVREK